MWSRRPKLCVSGLALGWRSGWPPEAPVLPLFCPWFFLLKLRSFTFMGKRNISPLGSFPAPTVHDFSSSIGLCFPNFSLASICYKKACTHVCIIRSTICNFEISRALKAGKFLMFDSKIHEEANRDVNYIKAVHMLYLLYLVWIFIYFTEETNVFDYMGLPWAL